MIRKASAADASTIAGFQLAMALETENMELNPDTVIRGVESVFDDPTKGFYLVTEQNGEVVSCLMVTLEWSDWRARTMWWIQSLYVKPEWRQKGIYRDMYNHLKQIIKNDDTIGGIRLYVDKGNITAQKAYEALGMDGNHYKLYEYIK